MVWLEEDEVCEEDEEVDELEEMGAEEPHSSLQRGQVCRSESGNEAICTFAATHGSDYSSNNNNNNNNTRGKNNVEVFIWAHVGPVPLREKIKVVS